MWQCHNGTAKTGTGLHLDNNDHSVANTVVYCSRGGMVINGSAMVVRNAHVYTEGPYSHPNGCAYVPSGVSFIRFVGCYFDGCPIYADDPQDLEVTGSLFLFSSVRGPCCYYPVVLTPTRPNVTLDGVMVTGNVAGGGPHAFDMVRLNATLPNSFDHDTSHNVVVSDNGVSVFDQTRGVRPTVTRASMTVTASQPTTVFTANLSSILLLHQTSLTGVQYTLEITSPGKAFTAHALTSTSASLVTVETQSPVTGILRVVVDQSTYP